MLPICVALWGALTGKLLWLLPRTNYPQGSEDNTKKGRLVTRIPKGQIKNLDSNPNNGPLLITRISSESLSAVLTLYLVCALVVAPNSYTMWPLLCSLCQRVIHMSPSQQSSGVRYRSRPTSKKLTISKPKLTVVITGLTALASPPLGHQWLGRPYPTPKCTTRQSGPITQRHMVRLTQRPLWTLWACLCIPFRIIHALRYCLFLRRSSILILIGRHVYLELRLSTSVFVQ